MSLSTPLALCLGGLFACAPLALYCLWLASAHRRPWPTVVSGHADLLALLLGLSGFLLVANLLVPPAFAAALVPPGRDTFTAAGARFDTEAATPVRAGFALRCLIAGAVLVACWTRRDSLSVYHLDPSAIARVSANASTGMGVGLSAGSLALKWRGPRGQPFAVEVRGLPQVATAELLSRLRTEVRAAPASVAGGGRLTAAAAGLIAVAFTLIGAFLRLNRVV